MGMSATQARYLSLIAQQSDLEFQGQQINESRTTLSEQTNNLYSQLQDLSVPTPPHTTDYTTIKYKGSLGADTFNIGKVVPSGSTYSVNLEYEKAGNSTYSVGKAQITETPATIKVSQVTDIAEKTVQIANTTQINNTDDAESIVNGDAPILHKVLSKNDLTEDEKNNSSTIYFVKQTEGLVQKSKSEITDSDWANGNVYVQRTPAKDAEGNYNFTKGVDLILESTNNKTITPSTTDYSSYYVMEGDSLRHAKASDFTYNKTDKCYEFKSDIEYYKLDANGTSMDNPDATEGIGKSLAGNALMESENGLRAYLTNEQVESAIEALKNGFPEYTNYSDEELLSLFYVSFTEEGSMKVPHFVLKKDLETPVNGAQTQWVEYHDITTTGTYTKTESYDNCDLTFDTSGRITEIAIPITNDKGEVVYQKIKLTASSVTDEQSYEQAYNDYEYYKYQYDKEQQKINAQMSIIQQEDKKLELKLQRLDNERTQITTEIEALDKVINDNIEASYKTFSG